MVHDTVDCQLASRLLIHLLTQEAGTDPALNSWVSGPQTEWSDRRYRSVTIFQHITAVEYDTARHLLK